MITLSRDKVEHKIKRVKEILKTYERKEAKLSVYGQWSMGYYQGKLSVLEDILDSFDDEEEE